MKRTTKLSWIATLLISILIITLLPNAAIHAATRKTDVDKASKGNTIVGVEGTFEYVASSKILKRINQIRKEACEKGYINPSTGEKLTENDYTPIKWNSSLEWIAQLRAAECTVNESHTRPNSLSCFSITYKNEQAWAECLAWNYSGIMQGIEQWYEEKNDWVKQNSNAVTGHYEAMINPNYTYIGLGGFVRSSGGWHGVAAEFGFEALSGTSQNKLQGKYIQKIEVLSSALSGRKLSGSSTLRIGKSTRFSLVRTVTYPGIMMGNQQTTVIDLGEITWKSSKASVASIDSKGKVTAKKAGKTVISAKASNGKTYKKTVTVKK